MRDGDWKLVIPARDGCNTMTQQNTDMINGKIPMEITRPHRRELGPKQAPLLFNIIDDPCEKNDLSQSYVHRTNEMCDKLTKWFSEINGELDEIVARRFS